MSKTEWIILYLLFIAYLFAGATIFYKIERDLEEEKREQAVVEQKQFRESLTKLLHPVLTNDVSVNDMVTKLSIYCNENSAVILAASANSTDHESKPYTWTYYNAFFFALTTLSTIGYGNLTPSTNGGRVIVIFYALFGIPFNGIVLATMGDFFGSVFLRAHHRYKNHFYVSKINLVLDILIYLVPGMVVFIFAPAILFIYFEDWSFGESIYYAFVTLTTIGYGDFVAGQFPGESAGETAYKIFLLLWIMFGLGYLGMILGFIARAMKSKRLNKIERKLANTLKQTQSKIWNEFVDDLSYIRRAINETYLNKLKPVYKDKKPLLVEKRLTESMPDLSEWPILRRKSEIERMKEDVPGFRRRRRAFSEHDYDFQVEQSLPRVMSEGALGDIDKVATFRDRPRPSIAAIDKETEELLANLVNQRKMSVYEDPRNNDVGRHLFSDNEILQSEQQYSTGDSSSSWTRPKRSRAASEVPYLVDYSPGYDRQKTWSGVDSLHTRTMIKNMRSREGDWESGEVKEKERASPANSFRRLSMAAMNFFSGEKKKKMSKEKPKKERKTGNTFSRTNSGHRLSLQENEHPFDYNDVNYYTQNGRRPSLLDVLTTPRTGQSTPMSPVLEQTSLADFLRVMSTLRKLEEQQTVPGERSRHPSLSYLFNNAPPLPRELLRAREASASTGNLSRERRYSQVPPRNDYNTAFRQRASSISPDGVNAPSRNPGGRFTPPSRAMNPPPTVVVTSPDGHHRFSVHNVASQRNDSQGPRRRRGDSLSEYEPTRY